MVPEYLANSGPPDGPMRFRDVLGTIGVQDEPGYCMPIGTACCIGWNSRGWAVFKLENMLRKRQNLSGF